MFICHEKYTNLGESYDINSVQWWWYSDYDSKLEIQKILKQNVANKDGISKITLIDNYM